MTVTFSEEMDPNSLPKKPFGLKAKSTVNRITLNPSSPNQLRGDILLESIEM